MKDSLISIVTVSYNAVNTIEQTIISVINQTYTNIEYIIIDGGSKDGTVDIIKKYSDKITYWISEPDKGIYDAMNKGILLANGEFINFMNAGDYFISNTTIDTIFKSQFYNEDIIYGAVEMRNRSNKEILKPKHLDYIKQRMVFCHQSTFVKLNLMKKYKFDDSYKIVADYDFFLKNYFNKSTFREIDVIVSSYDNNGISSFPSYSIYKKHLKELIKLENKYALRPKYTLFYYLLLLKYKILHSKKQK